MMSMVAVKGMEMPSCCMNCNMFRVLDGQVRTQCTITETYIDDSDEYLDKRADDCPLLEIVTCKDCDNRCTGGLCTKHNITVTKDFYCKDGIRKE